MHRSAIAIGTLLLFTVAVSFGQSASPSNLSVLQKLLGSLGREVLHKSNVSAHDTLQITALGATDEGWIVEQAIAAAIRDSFVVLPGDSNRVRRSGFRIEVLPQLRISYGKSVGSNLLGASSVERNATASLEYRVIGPGIEPAVLSAANVQASSTDTIAVSDIPSLETAGVRSTQAQQPEGSFLDSIAKPLIIIGSIGTIIFLLFHIRS